MAKKKKVKEIRVLFKEEDYPLYDKILSNAEKQKRYNHHEVLIHLQKTYK